MVELSLSLPDDLVEELRAVASDDVSAFVATAVRHELDRQLLASAAVAEAGGKHRHDGA